MNALSFVLINLFVIFGLIAVGLIDERLYVLGFTLFGVALSCMFFFSFILYLYRSEKE